MGIAMATPGTPLLQAVKTKSSLSGNGGAPGSAPGSRKTSGSTPGANSGGGGGIGESETARLAVSDVLSRGLGGGGSGEETLSATPMPDGSDATEGAAGGVVVEVDGEGGGGGSGEGSGEGGGGASRPRASTSRKLRELVNSIDKPVIDVAVDWPEPPLGGGGEGGGGGGGGGAARRSTASPATSVNPSPERWYDMEVASAARLLWRRMKGARYSSLEGM